MAAPVIYKSTDASAPSLTGVAGSLITVLDAVLVNGYGSKVAAGWAKAFTGTNGADYRPPVGGNRFYLDVNDNGASNGLTGASGQEAAVRAYEAMTAYQTGTNPFPTTALVAALTANWRKSAAASATTRAWVIAADDRTMIAFFADGDSANVYKAYYFGDLYSLKSADGFRTAVTVRTVVNSALSTGSLWQSPVTAVTSTSAGFYLPRLQAGTGTAINGAYVGVAETAIPYTGNFGTKVYMDKIPVTDGNNAPYWRGWLRGVWAIRNGGTGLSDGDTFDGTGDLAGRSFLVVKGISASSSEALAVETTAWDTSS